jgi:hypothetical protein
MNDLQTAAFEFEEFLRNYKCGKTKAYEEINEGRLRALKIGRKTIVTRADADAWLASLPELPTHTKKSGHSADRQSSSAGKVRPAEVAG